jgi:hypothetical protein
VVDRVHPTRCRRRCLEEAVAHPIHCLEKFPGLVGDRRRQLHGRLAVESWSEWPRAADRVHPVHQRLARVGVRQRPPFAGSEPALNSGVSLNTTRSAFDLIQAAICSADPAGASSRATRPPENRSVSDVAEQRGEAALTYAKTSLCNRTR